MILLRNLFCSERIRDIKMPREFYVVIERDEDGMFVGEAPQLRACYSQGRTLDELLQNIQEVVKMCLEELLVLLSL
jgi:predicted RNase H-like HicB family nuclease